MTWATSYLLPAEYSVQAKWPPYSSDTHFGGNWMVVGYDGPKPPADFNGPWWFYPESEWPVIYKEPKVFGAFSARRVTMWPENLQNYPPFGNVKVKTPSRPKTGAHQLASVKVHMRDTAWLEVTPPPSVWAAGRFEEAMRQMSRKRPIKLITDEGTITIKSIRHPNWGLKEREAKEYRAAIKAKREGKSVSKKRMVRDCSGRASHVRC
jgi:hypothetical protein